MTKTYLCQDRNFLNRGFLLLVLFVLPCAPLFGQIGIKKPIRTKLGAVSGVATADGKISIFKGIPYAAPPVGALRWKEPQPAASWKGVLRADHFSKNCMQKPVHEFLPWTKEFMLVNDVSEDCLYLNVWTPAKTSEDHLAVYVFIYGGAFTSGAGDVSIYDGENLARKGIVVVNMNYRVGVFGFLAHPELTAESPHHSSGNYAFLDQLAALRWVKENIAAFGGDPGRVTIGGQSAGAISVGLQVVSPLAKGLFRGAITESGSGVSGYATPPLAVAEKQGEDFAKSLSANSLAELRAMPAEKLLDAATRRFPPDVDGWFLPDEVMKIYAAGGESDVPMIDGWNADENTGHPLSAEDFRKQAQERYGSMAAEFLKLYPADTDEQARVSQKQSARDRARMSAYLWAQERAKTAKSNAYLYFFTRAIPWPEHPEYGAFHSADMPYFFDNLNRLDRPYEQVDHEIAHEMSSYLVNFVKTGNPNSDRLPGWRAFEPSSKPIMELGESPGPIAAADPVKADFWTRYFASPESRHAPFL
jgi:para-nitrobenzyl esterase